LIGCIKEGIMSYRSSVTVDDERPRTARRIRGLRMREFGEIF